MPAAVFPSPDNVLVTVTQPSEAPTYVLTLSHEADNRLDTDTCQALLSAFNHVEKLCPLGNDGAVITTGKDPKFYSNGLDLNHAVSTPGFWETSFYPLLRRVLTYHLPCIAAINGHAFAAGAMLASCHDYRIGNAKKGFLCLNEVQFGAPLLPGMLATVSARLTPSALRRCVLEAYRFSGAEAQAAGFVDALADPADSGVLRAAIQQAESVMQFAKSGVYGKLKLEMNAATLALLDMDAHNAHTARMDAYDSAQESRAGKSKL